MATSPMHIDTHRQPDTVLSQLMSSRWGDSPCALTVINSARNKNIKHAENAVH